MQSKRDFHALVKAGIPHERLAFALNRIGTPAEEASARLYLEQAGYNVLDAYVIGRHTDQAQNSGKAITETHYTQLNEQADTLIQSLIDRITAHG